MKKLKILGLFFMGLLMLTGCKEDFFDVNVPSNNIGEDQVDVKTILPYVEVKISDMQYNIVRAVGLYDQQIASYHIAGADIHEKTSIGSAWYKLYANILSNLRTIQTKSEDQGNKYLLGIAQVLEVLAVQMATDQYGDMPYSEAAMGPENLYPKPDSQEEIYAALLNRLDQAIANLKSSNGGIVPGREDIIYGGDIDKWIKAAYTLKARIYLHLTKRNASVASDVLTALQQGMTSNDDDMQITYDATYRNPWYTAVVAARRTGNLSVLWSEQLIDYMNNTDIPITTPIDSTITIDANNDTIVTYHNIDARLLYYTDLGLREADDYRGAVNGSGGIDSNGQPANANFNDGGYSSEDAPIFLISYMEAKFMEAEANFMLGNSAQAYAAYMDGIEASFNKLGVPNNYKMHYLAEPAVAVGAGNLTISNIMMQKYIALVLHPEPWADMRRYNYDNSIFVDLDFPENRSTDIPADKWPARAVYPESEASRNPNIQQVEEYWNPLWIFQ